MNYKTNIPEIWGAELLGSAKKTSVFRKLMVFNKIRQQPFFGEYKPNTASGIKVKYYGS